MLNILIITVLALVVIAAGVEICRPKDHGEYEPLYGEIEQVPCSHGIMFSCRPSSPLMAAYMKDLHDRARDSLSIGYFEGLTKGCKKESERLWMESILNSSYN